MADYAITFARSARRELETLDASIVRRVISRIDALAQDPRPSGSRKLQGEQNLWRIRIGDYRVVYSVDAGSVLLILLESAIGETPIAKSKSNHTVHRAAFEAIRCALLDQG
jgi:mRNA interferase RelE/StbE